MDEIDKLPVLLKTNFEFSHKLLSFSTKILLNCKPVLINDISGTILFKVSVIVNIASKPIILDVGHGKQIALKNPILCLAEIFIASSLVKM